MPKIMVDEGRVELFYESVGRGPQKVLLVVGAADLSPSTAVRHKLKHNIRIRICLYISLDVDQGGLGRSEAKGSGSRKSKLELDDLSRRFFFSNNPWINHLIFSGNS